MKFYASNFITIYKQIRRRRFVCNEERYKSKLKLELFGKDRNIIVDRMPDISKVSKSFIGNTVKINRAFELSVQNLKQTSINLRLTDQIPVSADSDIIVSVDELSGATSLDTGEVIWELKLEPQSITKKVIKYRVSHPKAVNVNLD